jgi:hypothetical protein
MLRNVRPLHSARADSAADAVGVEQTKRCFENITARVEFKCYSVLLLLLYRFRFLLLSLFVISDIIWPAINRSVVYLILVCFVIKLHIELNDTEGEITRPVPFTKCGWFRLQNGRLAGISLKL